jgi:threonine aldolase
MIDIRSDTVTQPTKAMRKAMAEAEVGDDVYGDDPTVKHLEALCAEILGKEASLFVPTGTFGNQLALFTWCPRGTEVVLGEECHIVLHEAGAPAIIAGVQLRCISSPAGILQPDELKKRLRKSSLHTPATSLICLENAHSSGRVVHLEEMDTVKSIASQRGLPVHLDGARIFNAAAALGCTAREIADRVDSVMLCLSKGLCAPVGSLLAGTTEFIEAARYKRKIMGGGMRQAGILAAAGIIALTEHPPLLSEDHKRAKRLAHGLAEIEGIQIDLDAVEINMVHFNRHMTLQEAEKYTKAFAERGILINTPRFPGANNTGVFRFAIHYWISDEEINTILSVASDIFNRWRDLYEAKE